MHQNQKFIFISISLFCLLFVMFHQVDGYRHGKHIKEYTSTEGELVVKKIEKHYFTLTQETLNNRSFDEIQGTWMSKDENLIENLTENPLEFIYNIDNMGKGTKKIIISKDLFCITTIESKFLNDGRLAIRDLAPAQCNDNSVFSKSIMVCNLEEDGYTSCFGEQGSRRQKYRIQLFKKD